MTIKIHESTNTMFVKVNSLLTSKFAVLTSLVNICHSCSRSWQKNTFFGQILKRWVFMRSVLLMKHFKRLYNLVHCRFMSLNFLLWVRKSCYWLTTPLYTITPIKTTYTKNCLVVIKHVFYNVWVSWQHVAK